MVPNYDHGPKLRPTPNQPTNKVPNYDQTQRSGATTKHLGNKRELAKNHTKLKARKGSPKRGYLSNNTKRLQTNRNTKTKLQNEPTTNNQPKKENGKQKGDIIKRQSRSDISVSNHDLTPATKKEITT